MDLIAQELGEKLSAQQVANITGLDKKTVLKYHDELGGVKIGARYLFFERRLIDAIQKPKPAQQSEVPVDSAGPNKQKAPDKVVRFKETSPTVGAGTKANSRRDTHGIFG